MAGLPHNRQDSLGKSGSNTNGKLGQAQPHQPPIQPLGNTTRTPGPQACPECGSAKTWKDGIRETAFGPVQRYLCRNCAYRFSDPRSKQAQTLFNGSSMSEHVERIHTKKLKSKTAILNYCRVSNEPIGRASTGQLRLVKSLAEVETREEKPTREGTTSNTEIIKGLITQYMAYLEKEGYYEKSAYLKLMRRLARIGADLSDPENVKTIIAKQPWKNSVKMLAVYAYDIMVKQILKVQWTMPKYTVEETLPFVPEEKELDQLISACKSRRMATFLQTLKETYADPGEALKLEWKDVSENVITINGPVKGHSPRQLKVSSKLIAMLNALPKTSKRIFPSKYDDMLKGFLYVRKRAAQNLQNPRLLEISFRTFRHWGGTMIAHYTHGNVLTVQKLLGHKRIQNTMKYIHMITFKDDEFEVATATTVEEAKSVLATGFDYVTEKDGIMLFRRPKRFNA